MSEESRTAALREFMAKREVEGRELGITSEYTFKSGWDAGASKNQARNRRGNRKPFLSGFGWYARIMCVAG